MGDWLDVGAAFGGDIRRVLDEIRRRGFLPAIWVAPFVAEEGSKVFQQHRDWFVKDAGGAPLRSDRVTFGGWRRGPWYALDGTHPAAQEHFDAVFRTMRRDRGSPDFTPHADFSGAPPARRAPGPHPAPLRGSRRGM